jgi:hypothetical protein
MVAAYLAGGRDRAELFHVSRAVPGGFDVGGAVAVLPYLLSAAATAGTALLAFLGANATSLPTAAKDAVELWDRFHQDRFPQARAAGAAVPGNVPADPAYLGLAHLCDVFEAELARAGFDKDHRQLITYRAVRQLLRDEGGTREFLSALRPE